MNEMKKEDLLADNVSVSPRGELLFAGQSTMALAAEYGTPLYLMDENKIREKCRIYKTAIQEAFGKDGYVLYASKAMSCKRIYEIMKEEGMGIDVVSAGEIATAKAADYPLRTAFFHSNNKTDRDIAYAMDQGVGYFVVDNAEELYAIDREAASRNRTQAVLLRITPGIDPHTYDAVNTGKVDSKFGSAIETGQAAAMTELTLHLEHLSLEGFHCHVGSQVFDSSVYLATVDIMIRFLRDIYDRFGFRTPMLDLGGGYGVRYVAEDPHIDIGENIRIVAKRVKEKVAEFGIETPTILMEPGRSIVADAGMTLYTAGTVKKIPGYKTYLSVDGGMTDNPRYVLYGASYTVLPANRMAEVRDMEVSVVGRCCESGDIIQEHVMMPSTVGRGDLIATLTTGAYHYSMASNYNRIPRPPVVMLKDGKSYVAVRRETPEDVLALDV